MTVGQTDVKDLAVAARFAPTLNGRVEVVGDRAIPPASFELIVEAIDPGPFRVVNPRLNREYSFSTQLAPGRYMVSAFPGPGAWCTSTVATGQDVFGGPIEIREDRIVDVVLRCGGEPTRITGTVRNSRGDVDPRASVVAFPVDRRHWSGASLQPLRLVATRVTTSAAFSLVNVPPGEYLVAAIPDAATATWKDPKILDAISRSATRLSLAAGEARAIELRTVAIR